MKSLNDQLLEGLVLDGRPIVVAWLYPGGDSAPSKHFLPEFRLLSEGFPVEMFTICALENHGAADTFGIQAVPTTCVYADGKEIARWEGPYSCEAMIGKLKAALKLK